MKKRNLAAVIAAALMISLVLPGCGLSGDPADTAEETETPTPTKTATPTPTAEPAPSVTAAPTATPEPTQAPVSLDNINHAGNEEYADWAVILTNETDLDIISIQVAESDTTDFLTNILPDGYVMSNDESWAIYLDIPVLDGVSVGNVLFGADGQQRLNDAGISRDALPAFDLLLTYSDDSTSVIHYFDYSDMEQATILYDQTAYLDYVSVSDGTEYSTVDAELAANNG